MAIWTPPEILLDSVNLTNGTYNLTEWVDYSWAEEIQFMVDVQVVNGGPTAGTLSAVFQKRIPHKTGSIQYANQRLVNLASEELASWVVEGDWPSPLANFNDSLPLTYTRNVRHFGPGVNCAIVVAGLTGGTSPSFQTTVLFSAKGK